MNWWLFTALVLGWMFAALLLVSILVSILAPITGPLGNHRLPLVEAVGLLCLTAIFLGLLIVAP